MHPANGARNRTLEAQVTKPRNDQRSTIHNRQLHTDLAVQTYLQLWLHRRSGGGVNLKVAALNPKRVQRVAG